MTNLIDDIKRDHEGGTPGPWAQTSSRGSVHCQSRNGSNWICQGPNEGALSAPPAPEKDANARRIARVPDMEAALIAADELARAVCIFHDLPSEIAHALAAYRAAIGAA